MAFGDEQVGSIGEKKRWGRTSLEDRWKEIILCFDGKEIWQYQRRFLTKYLAGARTSSPETFGTIGGGHRLVTYRRHRSHACADQTEDDVRLSGDVALQQMKFQRWLQRKLDACMCVSDRRFIDAVHCKVITLMRDGLDGPITKKQITKKQVTNHKITKNPNVFYFKVLFSFYFSF